MTEALLLKITEAGDRLGVSRTTVYKLIHLGHLRTVKVLGAVRIPLSEVENYIERNAA